VSSSSSAMIEDMSPTMDLTVRARRAVVDGTEIACTVAVTEGRIASVASYDARIDSAATVELADDEVLLPGLVDTHVHVNEPGRTEWEGFASATKAAAAGGVTTIIDMPLNSVPPTTTLEALRVKQAVARDQIAVDVGFWGGAVPGNLTDLAALHEAGVFGFKSFLIDSGVDEFPHLGEEEFAAAMDEVARLGALMLVHAEDGRLVEDRLAAGATYAGFLASRPPAAESAAIDQVIAQARRTGASTHLLHLSSAQALPALRAARAAGVDLTIETCPHYLVFSAEEVGDGATEFKCCPPIREAGNREALWSALAAGDIDLVVSDHSPSTTELKWAPGGAAGGDFGLAWGGIASIQVSLPAVWTAARAHGFGLPDVVRWMALAPADRVGLTHKGRIEAGADADLTVLAPDEEFVVDVQTLAHKNPVSAYAGRQLAGVVRRTWLRGVPVESGGPTQGRFLERGRR
jgi:allantoinase